MDYAKDVCRVAKGWVNKNRNLVNHIDCNLITSCPEMTKRDLACQLDEAGGVRNFILELVSQLAAMPDCRGIKVVQMRGPGSTDKDVSNALSDKNHWAFTTDYVPGEAKQSWSMVGPHFVAKGSGQIGDIARKICVIAGGGGASVAN